MDMVKYMDKVNREKDALTEQLRVQGTSMQRMQYKEGRYEQMIRDLGGQVGLLMAEVHRLRASQEEVEEEEDEEE